MFLDFHMLVVKTQEKLRKCAFAFYVHTEPLRLLLLKLLNLAK